jgi:hypothetical protein
MRAYQIIRVPKPAAAAAPAAATDHGTVIQNQPFATEDKLEYYAPKLLVCSDWARGCTIQAALRADVQLPANVQGNRIDALYDDGGAVRRTYLSGGAHPDLFNLAPVDVQTITAPKVGDLAMDSGKLRGDGVPCLVYYNGKSWVPCGAPAPK